MSYYVKTTLISVSIESFWVKTFDAVILGTPIEIISYNSYVTYDMYQVVIIPKNILYE